MSSKISKIDSNKERNPISLWLAGQLEGDAFDEPILRFKIRREMTGLGGALQEGMLLVFGVECLHEMNALESRLSSYQIEVFDLPVVGDEILFFLHKQTDSNTLRVFKEDRSLLAVIQQSQAA